MWGPPVRAWNPSASRGLPHSPPAVRNVAPTTDRADHDAGIADRKDRKARRARHLVQMLEVRLLRDWGWSPDHVVFQRNVENITRRQIKKAEEWSDAIDAITRRELCTRWRPLRSASPPSSSCISWAGLLSPS